jgi:hypothetical protein
MRIHNKAFAKDHTGIISARITQHSDKGCTHKPVLASKNQLLHTYDTYLVTFHKRIVKVCLGLVLSLNIFCSFIAHAAVPGPTLGPYDAPFVLSSQAAVLGGVTHNLRRLEPAQEANWNGWISVAPVLHLGSPSSSYVRWWANLNARIGLPTTKAPTAGDMSEVGADIRLSVLPTGPISVALGNKLSRTSTSPDLSIAQLDATLVNHTSINLITGTRTLEFAFGYENKLLRHTLTQGADRDEHLIQSSLAYRFGSHAELFARTSFEWVVWPNGDHISRDTLQTPLRTTLGVEGFMTRHFWGRLVGGYATIFDAPGDGFSSGVGELAFGWDTAHVNVSFGIERTVTSAYWGQYASQNRAFLQLAADTGDKTQPGALQLRIEAEYDILVHGRFSPIQTTITGLTTTEGQIRSYASHAERQGQNISVQVTGDITLIPWLALRFAYNGTGLISNFRTQQITLSDALTESSVMVWNWRTHIIEVGILVFY